MVFISYQLFDVVAGTVPTSKPVKYRATLKSAIVTSRIGLEGEITTQVEIGNVTYSELSALDGGGLTGHDDFRGDKTWWYGTQFILSHNSYKYELFADGDYASRAILSLATEEPSILEEVQVPQRKVTRAKPPWPSEQTEALQSELEALEAGVGSFAMGKPFPLPQIALQSDDLKNMEETEQAGSLDNQNSTVATRRLQNVPTTVVHRDGSNTTTILASSTETAVPTSIPMPTIYPTQAPTRNPFSNFHGHLLPRVMAIDEYSALSMVSILHVDKVVPTNTTDESDNQTSSTNTLNDALPNSCAFLVGFSNLQPFLENTVRMEAEVDGTGSIVDKVWFDYFSVGVYARRMLNCSALTTSHRDLRSFIGAREKLSKASLLRQYPEIKLASTLQENLAYRENIPTDVMDDKYIVAYVHFHRVGAPRPADLSQVDEIHNATTVKNEIGSNATGFESNDEQYTNVMGITDDDVIPGTSAEDDDVGQEEIDEDVSEGKADPKIGSKRSKQKRLLEFVDGPVLFAIGLLIVTLVCKYSNEIHGFIRRLWRREEGYIPIPDRPATRNAR